MSVSPIGAVRHDVAALVEAIKAAVYSCKGNISVSEAVGAIEMAKLEIIEEQSE